MSVVTKIIRPYIHFSSLLRLCLILFNMQILFLLLLMASMSSASSQPSNFFSVHGPSTRFSGSRRLSRPLIGNDGRIYACSDRNFFAFQSNGSIAWTLNLGFTCNATKSPVHGGRGKIYLVAEDRVLKLNFVDVGISQPVAEIFFGPEKGQPGGGEIVALAVSASTSSVFINIKNQGLFAYTMRGQLLWSIGPMILQFGYRLGCRKGVIDCYFASAPVIDQCEASIYISNTAGELYSLSLRGPHFNWIQDLSSFDKSFIITPGNNGRVYVVVPTRTSVLALDVFTGNILWHRPIGPLSKQECEPVVDSNGFISIGSMDGHLYSISPTGDLRRFTKVSELDHVIQVSPLLDCSGYAVYISQTKVEGKVSRIIGDYTYVSAMKSEAVAFTLVVPATGAVHWSEHYPGQFSTLLSQSDLQHFSLDEGILLTFIAASRIGSSLQCRSKYEKLLSTCSQTSPKRLNIYTGNQRTIMWFLFFESIILVALAGLVRFCCIFWRKKKLQGQRLGNFLEKRRSLQRKKKEFDRTITELETKSAEEEALSHQAMEELGDLVRERQGVERKLSTTYSLGRDGTAKSSLLPVYADDSTTRSHSFQSGKKESVTIFHTLSETSSSEESSNAEKDETKESETEAESSSDERKEECTRSPSLPGECSGSKVYGNPLFVEPAEESNDEVKVYGNPVFLEPAEELNGEVKVVELTASAGRSAWLKRRRRTFSSTR